MNIDTTTLRLSDDQYYKEIFPKHLIVQGILGISGIGTSGYSGISGYSGSFGEEH